MGRKIGLIALALMLLAATWLVTVLIFGWHPRRPLEFMLLAGAVWLAGAALVFSSRAIGSRLWLIAGLLLLGALILVPPVFIEHEPWATPAWLRGSLAGFVLTQLLPALGVAVCALLIASSLMRFPSDLREISSGLRQITERPTPAPGETGLAPRRSALSALPTFSLAGLLLAGALYHLYWLFVWDSTYDSIDTIFLFVPVLAALFSAALIAELLHGRWRLTALAFALLVPALMIGVYLAAKQVDYRLLTEQRAARISQALERYHSRRGSYPASLDQLAPWTMLAVPEPVILHGQDWCYQGEQDAFRLGFVDREHWSSPELFATVVRAQGSSASQDELCAAEIARLADRYPDFYGLESR